MSLLPKRILKQGKVVTDEILGHIKHMKDQNKKYHIIDEAMFPGSEQKTNSTK